MEFYAVVTVKLAREWCAVEVSLFTGKAELKCLTNGEDQQDATVRCLLLTYVSTCFGHHYAHLQENKGPVTAFGVLFWFCWMWLVAVVGRCLAGC